MVMMPTAHQGVMRVAMPMLMVERQAMTQRLSPRPRLLPQPSGSPKRASTAC